MRRRADVGIGNGCKIVQTLSVCPKGRQLSQRESQDPPPRARGGMGVRGGAFWGERGVEWLARANQNDADFGVFTKKCFVKYRENGLLFYRFCIII